MYLHFDEQNEVLGAGHIAEEKGFPKDRVAGVTLVGALLFAVVLVKPNPVRFKSKNHVFPNRVEGGEVVSEWNGV